jgi:hypothetical protein
VDACEATSSIASVGAPIWGEDGDEHIATVRVGGGGAAVAYRKMWLAGDEPSRSTAGREPVALER